MADKFSFGREGQDVTPSWAKESTRDNGDKSVTYGRSDGGGKHGHSVRSESGDVKYSRTTGGSVVKDDSKSSSSGGGCFITTACIEYAGLSDDCRELEAMRSFRDEYVRHLPQGESILEDYYFTAPGIVEMINASEDRNVIYSDLFGSLRGVVALIESERFHEAWEQCDRTLDQLRLRYTQA